MEDNEIITLQDEDGDDHSFAVIDIFPVNAVNYAVLVPMGEEENPEDEDEDEDEDEMEAVIFRIVEEDEKHQTLYLVEDENEWAEVAAAWEERMDEEEGIDE